MKRLILATGNPGKVREMKEILNGQYDEVLSMREAGVFVDVVEDADSFLGNAAKKRWPSAKKVDCDVVADDSGLCVHGLGNRPGVYSARYSKEGTDEANNQKLVEEVSVLPEAERGAHYECAIVLARQGKVAFSCECRCDGHIVLSPGAARALATIPISCSRNMVRPLASSARNSKIRSATAPRPWPSSGNLRRAKRENPCTF